jgi:hypothetical protein
MIASAATLGSIVGLPVVTLLEAADIARSCRIARLPASSV